MQWLRKRSGLAMTHLVLIDPSVAVVSSEGDWAVVAERWANLVAWYGDSRTRLGAATFQELTRLFADISSSGSPVPAAMRKSAYRCVGGMLSRGPVGDLDSCGGELDSSYDGSVAEGEMLCIDLGAAEGEPVIALGTQNSVWPSGCADATHTEPALSLPLHFEPNLPTPNELRSKRASKYASSSVVIVGGQVEPRVLDELELELGIARKNLRWIPSELHKKPRNLDQMVAGAAVSGAYVICVTGRVGHSTSNALFAESSKRGTKYIEAETPNGILAAILDFDD